MVDYHGSEELFDLQLIPVDEQSEHCSSSVPDAIQWEYQQNVLEYDREEEPVEDNYYCEPSTSIVVYEEINRARCIDCDQVIDLAQPSKPKTHSCLMFKKLSCEKCGSRFNVMDNLWVHRVIAHTSQEEFVPDTSCQLCENKNQKKTFQRFSAYVAHLKSHAKMDNLLCATCGMEFEFCSLYYRHQRVEHGIQSKRAISSTELGYCNKCDLLMEQSKVESHRKTHTAHQKLERKKKPQDGEKNKEKSPRRYKCDRCDKSFVRPTELKRHKAIHEKTTIWKCFACDKEFAHQSGLRSHRKVVHGVENQPKYTCTVCGLSFNKKSNCDRHVKDVHPLNSKKPMTECPLCSCQYKTIGVLNKHLQLVHGVAKLTMDMLAADHILPPTDQTKAPTSKETLFPHKCFKCEKRFVAEKTTAHQLSSLFKLRSSLKIHLDVHARKEIDDPVLTDPKCPICMKHLSSRNNLRRHLLTHQNGYQCPDCCQRFHSIHRLDRHRCFRSVPNQTVVYNQDILVNPATIRTSSTPSKFYFCKQCPLSFYSFRAFKEHRSLHLGLKPHLCWTCHKSFRTADLLAMHKEIHSREPVYCEYCPMILNGRAQHGAHVRAVHQKRQALPSSLTLLPNRGAGIASTQSEYCADRNEQLEGFRTRAQSADIEPRETESSSWITIGNTETVSDRSLRCPMCCHEFESVAHLTQHFSNTQNERDHCFTVVQCPLCDMSVQGSAEALHHFSHVHTYVFPDSQSAQLAVYGPIETFEQRTEVAERKHHCTLCPSKFYKPSDLARHIRTHTGERPFECEICSRKFSLQSSLNSHVKIHSRGEPEFACTLCSSKFYKKNALTLHLRIHTGEKPLKCGTCFQTFRTSSARKVHEQSAHQHKDRLLAAPRVAQVILAPPLVRSLPATAVLDKGFVYPVARQKTRTSYKQNSMLNTLAQISKIDSCPLVLAKSSAFTKQINPHEPDFIHITARRITLTEYSVTIARMAPYAIREGVDSTSSIPYSQMKNLADQDMPLGLTLMDSQQLNVNAKGILEALGDQSQILFRAHPFNPEMRYPVELLPLHQTDFCSRCDICEVDLPTRELSEIHFASEDHETAQVLHPLADAVQDTIDDSLMITPAVSHHRREEVTCKLCGRKFLDTELLVAHIRLDHERDHPHNMAPRPIARTAPPLEAPRHQTNFL